MKKRILLVLALTAALLAGCSTAAESGKSGQATAASGETVSQSAETETKAGEEAGTKSGEEAETKSGQAEEPALGEGQKHHIKINVKDYGTITAELDPTYAPLTVENFLSLAKAGFYDGLTFHRIIDGFMIQGGDPLGTGMGGAETTIKGEFSSNGVDNPLSHTRGAISMARSQNKDSASSQFFIVQQDSTYLDGDYAVFGYVTEGMDLVDKICEDTAVTDNNGTVAKENQPVIESVEVVD